MIILITLDATGDNQKPNDHKPEGIELQDTKDIVILFLGIPRFHNLHQREVNIHGGDHEEDQSCYPCLSIREL